MTLALNDTARRVLAATSTAWTCCEGAAAIAARLGDMTPAQVSGHLGRLARAGLVERDAQDSTWCRYDSAAPGLEAAQVEALEVAEASRPCLGQIERVENYGPRGLTARQDMPHAIRAALEAPTPAGLGNVAHKAAALGQFHRAAALAREAARHCAGHGRRARLEAMAETWESQAEAEAEAQEGRGLPGPGATLPNGCRVLAVVSPGRRGRAYVAAETLGRAGHPFATWHVEADTWATHWGHYHATQADALADMRERAGLS